MSPSRLTLLFVCVLFSAGACKPSVDSPAADIAALKAELESVTPPNFVSVSGADKKLWDNTREFYKLRLYQPAWIVAGQPQPVVQALLTVLGSAASEGLNPAEYGSAEIPAKLQSLKAEGNAGIAQDLELYLSYQLLRYGQHVALGHPIANQIDPNWNVTPREIDLAGIVAKAVAGNDLEKLAENLAPPHAEYVRLREMLQRYRKLAAATPLQVIPTDLKLKAGETSPQLAVLRNNLLILGDLQEKPRDDDNVFDEDLSKAQAEFKKRNAIQLDETPDAGKIAVIETYDETLAAAVSRFESRHGLNPDGVPDAAMIAAMNVPLANRVRQLELNLERWRWMPADFGSPYLFVNIAGYTLQVRDAKEAVALKMRVIVGKDKHRTPILSDSMTELVFSPYWNIPESIQVKEMLPSLAKDSKYLEKHDIEVIHYVKGEKQVVDPSKINWARDGDSYQLRQKPGDENSLGFVKFLFPNRYNVYLHDTPNDNLFDKLTRDLSHGCVRVEQPLDLATYLLRAQPEWNPARIETAMHAGKEEHVTLKNPIPVHLVYLTARVDQDGVPQFLGDAYDYDLRQEQLLTSLASL